MPVFCATEAETVPNCSSPKQLTCIIGSDDIHRDTRAVGDWRRFAVRFIGRRTCLIVAIICPALLAAALLMAHNLAATEKTAWL